MNELAIPFHPLEARDAGSPRHRPTKLDVLLSSGPGKRALIRGRSVRPHPRAEMVGYHPQVIHAWRRINHGTGKFGAEETVRLMVRSGNPVHGSSVNVLHLTFKEDCPDLFSSRYFDVVGELRQFECEIFAHNPIADPAGAEREYGITLLP